MNQLAPLHPEKVATDASDSQPSGVRATLMVTGGELTGAQMNLDIGRTYSVGGDESYEIVLRGAVADDTSMQLTLNANGVSVMHSNQNTSAHAAYHDELVFGSSTFFIVQSDIVQSNELSTASSSTTVDTDVLNNTHGVEPANTDATSISEPIQSAPAEQNIRKRQRRFLRPVLYAVAIIFLGSSVAAVALWQGGTFTQPITTAVPVESLLADAGFQQLQVNRTTNATVVSGYVQSRQEALSLAQLLATQGESVSNRVKVDAEIRDQIENVLRVNGIAGLVESTGNGEFVANTQLPLGSKLDGLQGLIERDVPSVASFSVNNQLPIVEPTDNAIQLDSGKRVVLVNSEKPSYVVTEDESRYFVGSILPGGYRITDINSGRVLLEKQGKTTELKF